MFKIRRELLPIKAHFFFFFAAMGPLLPQMNVYGKQLGISPAVMGMVTSVLPIFWALAKPAIGFLVDYFHTQRKFVFMFLIILMSGSYFCIYFLPDPPSNSFVKSSNITMFREFKQENITHNPWIAITPCNYNINNFSSCANQSDLLEANCGWICNSHLTVINNSLSDNIDSTWNFWIKTQDTAGEKLRLTEIYYDNTLIEFMNCDQFNMENYTDVNNENISKESDEIRCKFKSDCKMLSCAFFNNYIEDVNLTMELKSSIDFDNENSYNLYTTITFWGFVIFMCMGTVAYNVANCISDAVCLDVLGTENEMKYGFQRAWGTAGYGLTALLSGFIVDYVTGDQMKKDFTPAFILMAVFTVVDLYFCRKLKLPRMSRPVDAGGVLMCLVKKPAVFVFLVFAMIVGVFDSFIIYYMFWFMEDIALETNQYGNIKFLEGLTIAAECFGGEILFFAISGKVLKRLGYRHTLSVGLLFYALRMFFISMTTQTWHLILVAMFLQGPTYALCYATIVGYAASIAPPGMSATLQGILAGMDDGIGFIIGSLLGGILYHSVGGRKSFRIMSILAIITVLIHLFLSKIITEYKYVPEDENEKVKGEENDLTEKTNTVPIDTNSKLNTGVESKLLSECENRV